MGTPLLTVERMTKRIGGRLLWRHLSFQLESGQRLALAGATGSGKTLLLRTLVLLDPLQEGSIHLLGRPPQSWFLPRYRAMVMYVPQRPVAFPGTVEDNLRWPWQVHRPNKASYDPGRISEWLAWLGKDSRFLSLDAQQLSGGETQLMALLRSLQMDPMILLLDEPTASLDEPTAKRLEELLREWQHQGDRALMVASHDPAQMERFTHQRLVLS